MDRDSIVEIEEPTGTISDTGTLAPLGPQTIEPSPTPPARRPQVVPMTTLTQKATERVMYSSSPEIGELVAALAKATMSFKDVERTREARIKSKTSSTDYTYEYETLADVIEATREGLSQNGLVVIHFPFPGTSTITVRTMLAHASGQWVANDIVTALPNGDNSPQSVGSGITYLMRYARKAILGISAYYDDDDGHAHRQVSSGGGALQRTTRISEQAKAAPQATTTSPVEAAEPLKAGEFAEWVGKIEKFDEPDLPSGKKGLRIILSTGQKSATADPEIIQAIKAFISMKATVKVRVRGAADPSRSLPTIVEIVPCRAVS